MKHATPYRSKDCARISTLAVLREHIGSLDETKVSAAMTERLMTVSSRAAFEQAAKLMLSQKISGFPVADEGMLVGIITMSDVLQAFLDVMGVSEEGSSRIDFLLEQDHDLALASKTVAEKGGKVIGVGTYRDQRFSVFSSPRRWCGGAAGRSSRPRGARCVAEKST